MKLRYGFDIGITSVGWSVMDFTNPNEVKLVDHGTRKFEEALEASERRVARGARRNNRRSKWRINQVKKAFIEFNVESISNFDKEGYKVFSATHKNGLDSTLDEIVDLRSFSTIYHLRQKGLNEQLTTRELYLCMLNIVKTRGNFLFEDIDFTNDGVSAERLINLILEVLKQFDVFEEETFINEVLEPIFITGCNANEIKRIGKNMYAEANEELFQVLLLLKGYSASKLTLINDEYKKKKITDYKKNDVNDEFIERMINIYDLSQTYNILCDYSYLCDKHVDTINKYNKIKNSELKEDLELLKSMSDLSNRKEGNPLRLIKNTENNYPNGLYEKEVVAILKKQAQFNSNITEEFIDVMGEIVKARIPYYIGPIDRTKNSNFSWSEFSNDKLNYSYSYAKNQSDGLIDEEVAIKTWMDSLVGRCRYINSEQALPSNSLLMEIFSVLNELNIRCVQDSENSEKRSLTTSEKELIITELFLKQKDVKISEVQELLSVFYFGYSKEQNNKLNKFITVYNDIKSIVPELQITDLRKDIIKSNKIDVIEGIILALAIFEDSANRANEIRKIIKLNELNVSENQISILARLKCGGFASLSKRLLVDIPFDQYDNRNLIDTLFDFEVEQMTILSSNKRLTSNYYEVQFSQMDVPKLSYDLLIDKNDPNKARLPISRAVLRALNESMKVYSKLEETYGIPEKVVIETARDLKDSSQGQETVKHFNKVQYMYDEVSKVFPKDKNMVEWEQIQSFLLGNKKKIELYIMQNGYSLLTGKPIDITRLQDYQIDHILPRGCGDDSMNNSMLISSEENNQKANQVPLEYIRSANPQFEQKYKKTISKLLESSLITPKKYKLLMLENTDEAVGFVEQNLVDTRYIIKEFGSILKAYSKAKQEDTQYSFLQGHWNSPFRSAFEFYKSRDCGDAHHAEDAGIVIIADACFEEMFGKNYQNGNRGAAEKYKKFIDDSGIVDRELKDKSSVYQKNNAIFREMYSQTFSERYFDHDSVISDMKSRQIKISWKPIKKYTGKLFEATLISPKKERKQGALDVIGVNNDERTFSGVECVAVDFYKVDGKHMAVHIPKAIIDKNGMINEKLYKKLVLEHFGSKKLILEDGSINEKAYRFRAFKNDLIYDTENFEVFRFSIGSIANKILEVKEVLNLTNDYVSVRLDYFKKLLYDNLGKFVTWQNINSQILEDSLLEFIKFYKYESYEKNLKFLLSLLDYETNSEQNLSNQFKKIIYYLELSMKKYRPSSISSSYRILPTVNNGNVKSSDKTQYIKLVHNELGISYILRNKRDLHVSGSHKRIKKEEFKLQI